MMVSNLCMYAFDRVGDAAGSLAAKLDLLGEWTMWGVVESLSALRGRFAGIQRDAILLTFRSNQKFRCICLHVHVADLGRLQDCASFCGAA